MSKPRHTAALTVGVVLAIVAVVIGTTAAVGWAGRHHAPAQSATAKVGHQRVTDPFGSAAPGSMASRIPDTSVVAENMAMHTKPGVLVARGKDFRIERVTLSHPLAVSVHGRSFTANAVYRITITAGPYVVRDMPDIISVDGNLLAVGMESPDQSSLTAFTFDSSVLTQGAHLRVSYGLPNATTTIWTATVEVVR